jgi:hypothetical protein
MGAAGAKPSSSSTARYGSVRLTRTASWGREDLGAEAAGLGHRALGEVRTGHAVGKSEGRAAAATGPKSAHARSGSALPKPPARGAPPWLRIPP